MRTPRLLASGGRARTILLKARMEDLEGRQTLLLVDGEPKSLRVLEVSLKKAGYEVVTATNGTEALAQMVRRSPDLVISDTNLPEVDGFELCRRIKDRPGWAHIPFIFVSSRTAIEDKIRGLELGVEDYLIKPVYIKEIVTRVRMLLQRRQRAHLESRRETRTKFAGHLSEIGIVDLVQTIEVNRKSGIVHIADTEGRRAAVYFRDGRVIDAEIGRLSGVDAVYRLFSWSEGVFEVEFKQIRRRDVVELSAQALLMEGMRRLDEWTRTLDTLPRLESVFEVDYYTLAERLAEIPDEVNGILRLFDGRRTFLQVIDDSDFPDLEALTIIQRLHKEKIIYAAQVDRAMVETRGGTQGRLERWLSESPWARLEPAVTAARHEAPASELRSPLTRVADVEQVQPLMRTLPGFSPALAHAALRDVVEPAIDPDAPEEVSDKQTTQPYGRGDSGTALETDAGGAAVESQAEADGDQKRTTQEGIPAAAPVPLHEARRTSEGVGTSPLLDLAARAAASGSEGRSSVPPPPPARRAAPEPMGAIPEEPLPEVVRMSEESPAVGDRGSEGGAASPHAKGDGAVERTNGVNGAGASYAQPEIRARGVMDEASWYGEHADTPAPAEGDPDDPSRELTAEPFPAAPVRGGTSLLGRSAAAAPDPVAGPQDWPQDRPQDRQGDDGEHRQEGGDDGEVTPLVETVPERLATNAAEERPELPPLRPPSADRRKGSGVPRAGSARRSSDPPENPSTFVRQEGVRQEGVRQQGGSDFGLFQDDLLENAGIAKHRRTALIGVGVVTGVLLAVMIARMWPTSPGPTDPRAAKQMASGKGSGTPARPPGGEETSPSRQNLAHDRSALAAEGPPAVNLPAPPELAATTPGAAARAKQGESETRAEAARATAPSEAARAPDDLSLADSRCRAAHARGNAREVLRLCPDVLKLNPRSTRTMLIIAEAELDRGQTREALRWARKALDKEPALVDALVFIGGAEQELGNRGAAKEAYEKYLELQPQGAYARDLRVILRGL